MSEYNLIKNDNTYTTTYKGGGYEASLEFRIDQNKIYLVDSRSYKNNKHIGTWDYKAFCIRWVGQVLTPKCGNLNDAWEWFYLLNADLCKIIDNASDLACKKDFILF
jgi:hypothetical protein